MSADVSQVAVQRFLNPFSCLRRADILGPGVGLSR